MTKPDMQKRLSSVRNKLVNGAFDAVLVTKRENCLYLSGFTGDSAYLLITVNEAILVTDFRYMEQARIQAEFFNIIKYEGSLIETVVSLIRDLNIKKAGFEEDYMPFGTYKGFASKLGHDLMCPMQGIIESLRMIKDCYEIDTLKKAVEIADLAFEHILKFIKPGASEQEIAAELEYFMKKQGAAGPSFETIIASGKRSSMPHGTASEKKLEHGDTVILDFGALYSGYCSDMTRTVFIGEPKDDMKKIYNTVLKAQLESLGGAFRGCTGKEVDAIARNIINSRGYEGKFGHGLGHGVGLYIHEEPRLSPSGDKILENGMAVTVEPGIYIDGFGGVRIEDTIVINDDRPVVLTRSTKDMIVL